MPEPALSMSCVVPPPPAEPFQSKMLSVWPFIVMELKVRMELPVRAEKSIVLFPVRVRELKVWEAVLVVTPLARVPIESVLGSLAAVPSVTEAGAALLIGFTFPLPPSRSVPPLTLTAVVAPR